MMGKWLTICVLLMLGQAFATDITEQSFNYSIKTANIDSVFQKIIQVAESKGGNFTTFTNSYLFIKIPVSALQELQLLISSLAEIESKGFSSTNKNIELEKYNTQIQSRKKLFETYMDLVKNAPFAELQAVERELVSLNNQIEDLQGKKQAIEKRAALASVTIIAEKIVPKKIQIQDYASPFKWINSTNLNSLRGDF